MNFFLGLDLGQVSDYTAIAIVEKLRVPTGKRAISYRGDGGAPQKPVEEAENHFHLRYLDRLTLGTSYPDVARRVKGLLGTPQLAGKTTCVVDATGVGRPVVDMLREADVTPLVAVTITGGDVVSRDVHSENYRVPKRDLVSTMQVLLQNDRLKIADGLPLSAVLVKEMQNFRTKIILTTGHDSYEAWREGDHDDLVLAVALALWYAMSRGTGSPGYVPETMPTDFRRPIRGLTG